MLLSVFVQAQRWERELVMAWWKFDRLI